MDEEDFVKRLSELEAEAYEDIDSDQIIAAYAERIIDIVSLGLRSEPLMKSSD